MWLRPYFTVAPTFGEAVLSLTKFFKLAKMQATLVRNAAAVRLHVDAAEGVRDREDVENRDRLAIEDARPSSAPPTHGVSTQRRPRIAACVSSVCLLVHMSCCPSRIGVCIVDSVCMWVGVCRCGRGRGFWRGWWCRCRW
jgi:hypothetical protein